MQISPARSPDNAKKLAFGLSVIAARKPIEAHKYIATKASSGNRGQQLSAVRTVLSFSSDSQTSVLDAYKWLGPASKRYRLSPNFSDYVIVPDVPTLISDIPNTNGVAFPRSELLAFNPDAGRLAFQTFIGKPCFIEHQNKDITKAVGIILDCTIKPVVGLGSNLIQVVKLLGFDRTKNPQLAEKILEGKRNAYSMGATFNRFTMSDGSRPTKEKFDMPLYRDRRGDLVYAMVHEITGFETSSVQSPAYVSATNTRILSTSASSTSTDDKSGRRADR